MSLKKTKTIYGELPLDRLTWQSDTVDEVSRYLKPLNISMTYFIEGWEYTN